MCFFLQCVNFEFPCSYRLIFFLNLIDVLSNSGFQLFSFYNLCFDTNFFVCNLTCVQLNIRLNVLQLVLSQLQFGLRLKRHITNLGFVVLVLRFYVFNLLFGVVCYLINNFFVFRDNCQNFTFLLVDLTLLYFYILAVLFRLFCHFLNVISTQFLKSSLVSGSFLILL